MPLQSNVPGDSVFLLNVTQFEKWKSQLVTSNPENQNLTLIVKP